MKRSRLTSAAVLLAFTVFGAPAAFAQDDNNDELFYFLGQTISQNLEVLSLSAAEAKQVVAGLKDSLAGKGKKMDPAVMNPKVQALTQQRFAEAATREEQASQDYIAAMAKEKGATQAASGLVYKEIRAGDGAQPVAASTVRAHYKGTLRDGKVFDSSYDRGEPITIGLGQVIPCWTEGIAMMKVGGKAKLTCPSAIAYGPRGQGGIPGNAALTFEVELLEVMQ